ncbi:hypothetical protein BpHYR1_017918 [Brachionus plicatilis]|uniref:Uncharacterized protein n=1 Tax=Brachionus plicatilis TaxID=10195 RepID=A0A3M7SXA2_BRAPC|nr:hypothetical protein BpHYR1_017918 [Brachionus plicatilis]
MTLNSAILTSFLNILLIYVYDLVNPIKNFALAQNFSIGREHTRFSSLVAYFQSINLQSIEFCLSIKLN